MYSKFKANNTLTVSTDACFVMKFKNTYYSVTFISESVPCNTELDTVNYWVDYYEFAELSPCGEVKRILDSSDIQLIKVLERNLSINLNSMKSFVDTALQVTQHEADQHFMINV